jgi:hypothetical protein
MLYLQLKIIMFYVHPWTCFDIIFLVRQVAHQKRGERTISFIGRRYKKFLLHDFFAGMLRLLQVNRNDARICKKFSTPIVVLNSLVSQSVVNFNINYLSY